MSGKPKNIDVSIRARLKARAADQTHQNARANSDKGGVRLEHVRAVSNVIAGLMRNDSALFKQLSDNGGGTSA